MYHCNVYYFLAAHLKKIIITLMILLWFFSTLQPTVAKEGKIQTQMLRICDVFDAIFIFKPFK